MNFAHYRPQFEQLIPSSDMHYMESYNASEGYFALQDDPRDEALLLMLDYGVFYEFIPVAEYYEASHEWIIEFAEAPSDLHFFMELVDSTIQEQNSDYEAKRKNDVTFPIVRVVPEWTFCGWMVSRGRVGGQNKAPRLCNDRTYADSLQAYLEQRC